MDTEKIKIEEFTLESESELHFEIKGKNKKMSIEVSVNTKYTEILNTILNRDLFRVWSFV